MIAVPLRWNPLMRDLARPIGVSLMLTNLVLGILGYRFMRESGNALPWITASVWIGPAVHLLLLAWRGRPLQWELALPVPTRSLWRRHLEAMTASGLLVWSVTTVLIMLMMGIVTWFRSSWPYPPLTLLGACLMGGAGIVPVAAWAHGRRPEFRTIRVAPWVDVLVVAFVLLVIVDGMSRPWPTLAGLVVMTAASVLVGFRAVPVAWSRTVEKRSAVTETSRGPMPKGRRWSLDLRILMMAYRATPRGLLTAIFMMPMIMFFGLLMGGGSDRLLEGSELRLIFLPMTAYVLLAAVAYPMAGLKIIDSLPLSRGRLLFAFLAPYVVSLLVGYGGGVVWSRTHVPDDEQILFANDDERYGLLVPLMLFDVAAAEAVPEVEAPWGERHGMMTVPVFGVDDEADGPMLWKPYTVPRGASREFAGWQLSRALEDLHGKVFDPVELAERYFVVNADGLVEARGGELTFAADHPGLRNRGRTSMLPVILGLLGLLWLPPLAVYLSVCRVRHTKARRKYVLWSQMGVLLLLHVLSFLAPALGWFRPDRLEVAATAWLGQVTETLPGGPALLWAPTMFILVAGTWLVVRNFRAHEAGYAAWWGCLMATTDEGRS